MKLQEQKMSAIGKMIDSPLEVFKKELVSQQINVGTMVNINLYLTTSYNNLMTQRENIINQCSKGKLNREDPEVIDLLMGIYNEMMKIEDKVLYLKSAIAVAEKLEVDTGTHQ